ncbi:MAG: VOC family protein [gamma proteobacterium endosymbiont of Lamellibrachia anaximandri]|nr:VOC family protein [gamma proteobacterium endosymbiont of Lamellibrachia anaximandri]MBL3535780.1 VOC family protein [gamma proteobacterium endosymbiont of Lamellibrachia anaximandri]
MNNPVGWFEICVQDISRAKAFYENVLSLKLDEIKMPGIEMWTFPMNPEGAGASGAIVKMEGRPPGGNSTTVYFSCEDCAIEENKASIHGGKILKEKCSIGEHGFISLVTDTEGNMIGLHSMK